VAEAAAARDARKEKFFERTCETLRQIVPVAEKHGIKLGCENREAIQELPVESDFPFLFREFNSPSVVYWHDTGHAQIKDNLGFIHHPMHLRTLAPHLAGFHVHDVKAPLRDHCSPGTGTVDFAALKPFVKPEHIKVFELSPSLPLDSVQRGIAHLKRIWGGE
jgi:sugar phosphate isomerase/epimerase